jgi:hypothetical protein
VCIGMRKTSRIAFASSETSRTLLFWSAFFLLEAVLFLSIPLPAFSCFFFCFFSGYQRA